MVRGIVFAAAALAAAFASGQVASSNPHAGACLRATRALEANAPASDSVFAPIDCPSAAPVAAFRYDVATGAIRMSHAVSPGDVVPVFAGYGGGDIMPGDALSVVVTSGPVRIERRVVALQRGRPGHRLFVRADDGAVLVVRYERPAP